MKLKIMFVLFVLLVHVFLGMEALSQTAQLGARLEKSGDLLVIERVMYRPAQWEKEKVKEYESEIVNHGGLVHVYYRNVSNEPIRIRYWRWNRRDRSHWVLNHLVAWDRMVHQSVQPGELGVLEINGVSPEFGKDSEYVLQLIDDRSRLCASVEGKLMESLVRVTYIRVLPGLDTLMVFVRNFSEKQHGIESVTVFPAKVVSVEWTKKVINAGEMAIGTVKLDRSLELGNWFIVGVELSDVSDKSDKSDTGWIYAHRRAFEDVFPIGVWTNSPETYETLYNLHVDTMVEGGKKDNPFFTEVAPRYGFRAMVHTGVPLRVETVQEFSGHPHVVCWMLQDEPDWSIPANIMFLVNQHLMEYDRTKPTFITLCRNIKFFEYASICDIPCQDHYSVTAPSSSNWPKFYGTRLEETAYYTRDLKLASEPKPIWIWSQAIATWTERPKRPVPTPEELNAQLVLNIGRGAKGILWFNHEKKVADKYPELEREMQGWGRVMSLLREYFLSSDPIDFHGKSPEHIDIAPLLGKDFMLLCVTNLDYEIHPEAYPFVEKRDIMLSVVDECEGRYAWEIKPNGIEPLPVSQEGKSIVIRLGYLKSATIVLIHKENIQSTLNEHWSKIMGKEIRHLDK